MALSCAALRRPDCGVDYKRVYRLMPKMLPAICPRPRLSVPDSPHRVDPYRLREMNVEHPDQVWAAEYPGRTEDASRRMSMDGRGGVLDKAFIERLWHGLKYEDVYLKGHDTVPQRVDGVGAYVAFCHHERLHPSFDSEAPCPCCPQAPCPSPRRREAASELLSRCGSGPSSMVHSGER